MKSFVISATTVVFTTAVSQLALAASTQDVNEACRAALEEQGADQFEGAKYTFKSMKGSTTKTVVYRMTHDGEKNDVVCTYAKGEVTDLEWPGDMEVEAAEAETTDATEPAEETAEVAAEEAGDAAAEAEATVEEAVEEADAEEVVEDAETAAEEASEDAVESAAEDVMEDAEATVEEAEEAAEDAADAAEDAVDAVEDAVEAPAEDS